MNTTKITISIPQDILNGFRQFVGKRQISRHVAEMMEEKLKQEKKKKAFGMAKEFGKIVKKSNVKMGTTEIIKSYKNERKY